VLTVADFAGFVVFNSDKTPTDKTIAAVRIIFNMALLFNIYVIVNRDIWLILISRQLLKCFLLKKGCLKIPSNWLE
jgi:hypothetical protein